jgi:hypothetical protein
MPASSEEAAGSNEMFLPAYQTTRRHEWGVLTSQHTLCVSWAVARLNRSTFREAAPVLLSQPQIPRDLTRDRTRSAAVGSRELTA